MCIHLIFIVYRIHVYSLQMLDHTLQKTGDKNSDILAISAVLSPIVEKGEVNIYGPQNIKSLENILSSRCSKEKLLNSSLSVVIHEDSCSVPDSHSSEAESGHHTASGPTENGNCKKDCNRKSMKSIHSINTRAASLPLFLAACSF